MRVKLIVCKKCDGPLAEILEKDGFEGSFILRRGICTRCKCGIIVYGLRIETDNKGMYGAC
jgi:hypothetical protein